jgi:hypothetical protein
MRVFDWDPIRAEHYGQRLHGCSGHRQFGITAMQLDARFAASQIPAVMHQPKAAQPQGPSQGAI